MSKAGAFEDYLASLGRLTAHIDPTASTPEAEDIREAAESLTELGEVTAASLAAWAQARSRDIPVLGLTVGLSQEKLKNALRHRFGTAGWVTLARERPAELVQWLDEEYDLVRLTATQLARTYSFGEILVARAGKRTTATSAGTSGRMVEDRIEAIAQDLGLEYETRTQFLGRNGQTAPCDLVVPSGGNASIAVAAKGFDSTGSKLSDAVTEIEKMASVRLPRQYIMAVVDGIGWKSRQSDLRRLHRLWEREEIDGLYTLASFDRFRDDLEDAAKLRGLL